MATCGNNKRLSSPAALKRARGRPGPGPGPPAAAVNVDSLVDIAQHVYDPLTATTFLNGTARRQGDHVLIGASAVLIHVEFVRGSEMSSASLCGTRAKVRGSTTLELEGPQPLMRMRARGLCETGEAPPRRLMITLVFGCSCGVMQCAANAPMHLSLPLFEVCRDESSQSGILIHFTHCTILPHEGLGTENITLYNFRANYCFGNRNGPLLCSIL